ncbi:DUF2520 domain-containing protein [bacterium]|nr:DUF2520 domain-containing protein [bacterium]
MRQEPEYLVIGSGRLARHLVYYLSEKGARLWFYSRSELGELENRGTRVHTIKEAPTRAIRLLLLRDDVLISFTREHKKELSKAPVIQFCGSLSIQEFPVSVSSFHPLFTFPSELYPFQRYSSIPFVIENGSLEFHEVFPFLENPVHFLATEQKLKYHALTSSVSNFLSVIIQQFFKEREDMNLSVPAGYFENIATQALTNAFASPKTCLTGPIARGDSHLVEKHLGVLEGTGLNQIYQGILKSMMPHLSREMTQLVGERS